MGKIRQVITPEPHEVEKLRRALNTKETSEPVLRELRAHLAEPIPAWFRSLDEDSDLSPEAIVELAASFHAHVRDYSALPAGPARDVALGRQKECLTILHALYHDLTGTKLDENTLLTEHDGSSIADAVEALAAGGQ